jgi:hypothetical protein
MSDRSFVDTNVIENLVLGRGNGLPCSSKMRKSGSRPGIGVAAPSASLRSKPAM